MPERQTYRILSRDALSDKNQAEIINLARGAFLTWVGDEDHVEKEKTEKFFEYTLNCSELTSKNKHYLTNKMLLRVESVSEADLSARFSR